MKARPLRLVTLLLLCLPLHACRQEHNGALLVTLNVRDLSGAPMRR